MVKRSLITCALACAALLLAVVAPALSARRYQPEPVQFSMPASADSTLLGSAAARGAGVVSKPLRAARRFNVVGLTWRSGPAEPGIAIRTRRDGGAWSRWNTVYRHAEDGPDPRSGEPAPHGTANPVWAGEADWVQYRSTVRLRGLRLHFVNVRGTATLGDRLVSGLRRAANAGFVSVARTLAPDAAEAQAGRPAMVSRQDWGASRCTPRRRPDYGQVKAAFVHHTVNSNDYSREEAPDVVLGICLFHRNTNGWDDVGYNFLVDRFGTIYEGRAGGTDAAVVGAQAQGYNAQSTGIANLGTFTSVRQTPEAIRAVARIIRWKLPLHGAPTTGRVTLVSTGGSSNRYPAGRSVSLQRVSGHRDTGATSCPGEALYAQLPEIRRLVAGAVPKGSLTQLDAHPEVEKPVAPGTQVPLIGELADETDAPLAGQPVEVQAFVGGRWKTLSTVVTDPEGVFASSVAFRRNRSVRVLFRGSADRLATTSAPFVIAVRPLVNLEPPASTAGVGRRAVVRGTVSPRKRQVVQVLQLRRSGRFRTVGTKPLRVAPGGRFRGSFVPAGVGVYRVFVVVRADAVSARGASRRFVVRSSRIVLVRSGGWLRRLRRQLGRGWAWPRGRSGVRRFNGT